jgi:hypothetical protein
MERQLAKNAITEPLKPLFASLSQAIAVSNGELAAAHR